MFRRKPPGRELDQSSDNQLEGDEICDYCGGACARKRYTMAAALEGGRQAGFCLPECALAYAHYIEQCADQAWRQRLHEFCGRPVNLPSVGPFELAFHCPESATKGRGDFLHERYSGLSHKQRAIARDELMASYRHGRYWKR